MNYKNWVIQYNPKPIPTKQYDYDATHVDYDGPEDERHFFGASIDECLAEVDERELEQRA